MSQNLSQLRTALLLFGGLTIVSTLVLVGDEDNGGMIDTATAGLQASADGNYDDENYEDSSSSDFQNDQGTIYEEDYVSDSPERFGQPTDTFHDAESLGDSAEGFDPVPLISSSDLASDDTETSASTTSDILADGPSVDSQESDEIVY